MKLDEPQKLLTVKEVAQRLGQSRFTIYRKIERGELPAVRIGAGVQILNVSGRAAMEGEGYVIRDGVVIVPKNGVIPDGTVI